MNRLRTLVLSRRWAISLAAGLVIAAGLGWGILSLPPAPNLGVAEEDLPVLQPGASALETVVYASPQVAWAILPAKPYWRLLRSTDAGTEWLDVTPLGAATNGGIELSVESPSEAIVSYRAYDYQRSSEYALTQDGGSSWSAALLPGAVGPGPEPMTVSADGETWAVLGNGELVSLQPAATSWTTISLPQPPGGSCLPSSVVFNSASSGWVTGSCHGVAAAWHTPNGGKSWEVQVLQAGYPDAEKVEVSPPHSEGAAGTSTTVVTSGTETDSVAEFSLQDELWTPEPAVSVPAGRLLLSFSNPSDGWAVDLPKARRALALAYQTSDGGAGWALRSLPISAQDVVSLSLLSGERAYLLVQLGSSHYLWSSANAGRTWTQTSFHIFAGLPPRVNGVTA